MECLQVCCVFWPAQGRKGPESGTEPGVQYVLVLLQCDVRRECILLTHFGLIAPHVDFALRVVPGRDAVSPPELPADAPVLDVAHPGKVHVLVLFGYKLYAPVLDRFDGGLGKVRDTDVPLVREPGFNHRAGTVTAGHLEGVGFDFLQQAQGLEGGHNGLARFEAFHARILSGCPLPVLGSVPGKGEYREFAQNVRVAVENIDQRQVVALADFVVVEVVRRGDFHTAGTEFRVHVIVGNDGDQAVGERQADLFADQMLVARILRVYRNGTVAQNGFRARSGHHEVSGFAFDGIAEMPE